jgi:hypothetical protein
MDTFWGVGSRSLSQNFLRLFGYSVLYWMYCHLGTSKFLDDRRIVATPDDAGESHLVLECVRSTITSNKAVA